MGKFMCLVFCDVLDDDVDVRESRESHAPETMIVGAPITPSPSKKG